MSKKSLKVWGLIVILVILEMLFVSIVSAQDIIIDTENEESRFTTDPPRELPYEWWYAHDHTDASADGWFDTKAYPPGQGNGNFRYTFCIPGMAEYKGIWQTSLPQSGNYEVFVWLPDPDPFDPNKDEYEPPNVYLPTTMANYKIYHKTGVSAIDIDQGVNKGGFTSLGVFDFDTTAKIELSNNDEEYWRCIAFDAVKFVPVTQNKPDLIVEDIWVDPNPPTPGERAFIWFKIKNQGTADVTETFYLYFYFDGGLVGNDGRKGLSAGSDYTVCWLRTWPSDTNPHTVRGVVDLNEDVSESDESNNERLESFSAVGVPDIRQPISAVSFGDVTVGSSSDKTTTIYNDGSATLTVNSITRSSGSSDFTYIGPSTPFSIVASGLKTITVRFAPSSTGSKSASFTINSNDPDEANVPLEVSGTGKEEPVHDMAVTDVYTSPSSPQVGQSTTIYVTVKNEGNQQESSVPVKAYVDGVQKGSTQYVTLSKGLNTTKSFSWTPDTDKTYSVKGEVGTVSDETDTADNSITIPVSTQSPAKPVLIAPLEITPEKETYYVGDILTAEFTIKNIGDVPITLDKLLVGGRFNDGTNGDGKLPTGELPDFTSRFTTLQPNVPYPYTGTLELTHPGIYQFFIAYYLENPTPEEKELLDDYNWNPCVDLGEGLTDKDRTEVVSALEKAELQAIAGGPYYGDINEDIQFHGSATGGIPPYTVYEWTFYDKDNIVKVSDQDADATYTWSTAGTYYAELRVKDSAEPEWSDPKGCEVHVVEPFTFVHITDTHIGAQEVGNRFDEAIFEINHMYPKPDFLLVSGDVVEYAFNDWFLDAGFYKKFLNSLKSLDSSIKVYVVPGNHDRYMKDLTTMSLFWYNKNINRQPDNCNILISPNNYSFNHKGFVFIGLDSGEDIDFPFFNGTGLSIEQIQKMESTFDKSYLKIIFMHHPVFNSDNIFVIKNNRTRFVNYCKDNNVQLVLTGHTHHSKIYSQNGDQISEYSMNSWTQERNYNSFDEYRPLFIQTPSAGKDACVSPLGCVEKKYKHGYRIIEVIGGRAMPRKYTQTDDHPFWWLGLDCPADLHVYDSEGRHTGFNDTTGELERNIPDSFYFGRYNLSDQNEPEIILLYNTTDSYQFEIVSNITAKQQKDAGTVSSPSSGAFNFTLVKQTNDSLTTIAFENVTIQENTTASVSVSPLNPVETRSPFVSSSDYTMEIDLDGNGEIDDYKEPDVIETDYAPFASIISPLNNSIHLFGSEIVFKGTGTDIEDGTLTNSSLTWYSNINEVIGAGNQFNSTNLSAGTHLIELMVNDSSSQVGMDTVTITVLAPDLAIDQSNLSFSNLNPHEGETVTINATVRNIGTTYATNITVQFFEEEPINGTQIGENQTITSLTAGENKTVSVSWNTAGEAGDNCIWVVVDPVNSLKEPNEENNQANKSIFVSAPHRLHILQAQTDRAVYVENEMVLITCLVQNASSNITANVSATIEAPDEVIHNVTLIEGSVGKYNGIFMNTSLSGFYKITLYANRTGFISDNESLVFEILDTKPPASITNLTNTAGSKWINWTWDNPQDPDFDYALIYLNGTWKTATASGYYVAEGLEPSTEYEIAIRTVDTEGNINEMWFNQTAKTTENEAPIASFTYSPVNLLIYQTVTLDASNSTDPDGNITTYNWTFGDGNTKNITGPLTTYIYTSARDYIVNLTVSDNEGATNTTSKTIIVTELEEFIFDTGYGSYPSIAGTYNGTIKPLVNLTVSNLYTYPCPGTGGHTEYVKILKGTEKLGEESWNGYVGDWHNLTFNESFTLYANETYNYTIRTGSYPQIHHTDELEVASGAGAITCTSFTDMNGNVYYNWIPAIRLY